MCSDLLHCLIMLTRKRDWSNWTLFPFIDSTINIARFQMRVHGLEYSTSSRAICVEQFVACWADTTQRWLSYLNETVGTFTHLPRACMALTILSVSLVWRRLQFCTLQWVVHHGEWASEEPRWPYRRRGAECVTSWCDFTSIHRLSCERFLALPVNIRMRRQRLTDVWSSGDV